MDPQNQNARFLDKFGDSKTTSVRIHHPPGGASSFSLGWEEPKKQVKVTKKQYDQNDNYSGNNINQYEGNQNYNQDQPSKGKAYKNQSSDIFGQNDIKSSVKVSNAPGGKSNFSLGNEKSNFKK